VSAGTFQRRRAAARANHWVRTCGAADERQRGGGVTALPTALASWGPSLDALTPDVAAALGPVLLRLDELVARHSGVDGPEGEPDGVDGLARRGPPDRLLVSEWLLAEEHPDEFLRRAATGELLHLATARRHEPPHGVVRVLVDTGPDQLGAGRLVQLAALVVLHRRAARGGAELRVGVLGQPADAWLGGDLPEVLAAWLRARRTGLPTPDDVRARTRDGGSPDAPTWLLCAPGLAAALPPGPPPLVPGRRTLTAWESGWDGDGARTVDVRLAGERLTLPLPDAPAAVRALRGEGFRRQQHAVRPGTPGRTAAAAVRHPAFPGVARRLVGRGESVDELATVAVPVGHGRTPPLVTPSLRRFGGPVLAAGTPGRRLVALHARGGLARIVVVGKHLAGLDGVMVPLDALGLPAELPPGLGDAPPAVLLFASGTLLCDVGDGWRRIHADGTVLPLPDLVRATPLGTDHPSLTRARDVPAGAEVRVGHRCVASSEDGVGWTLARSGFTGHVTVREGSRVAGVLSLDGTPGLVTVSGTGRLLRLVRPGHTRTLTEWCGGAADVMPAVHPTLPLLAVTRDDGSVEVADLAANRTVARVAAPVDAAAGGAAAP
jgi:hypothetical protein